MTGGEAQPQPQQGRSIPICGGYEQLHRLSRRFGPVDEGERYLGVVVVLCGAFVMTSRDVVFHPFGKKIRVVDLAEELSVGRLDWPVEPG